MTRNTPWPLYVPFMFSEGVQMRDTAPYVHLHSPTHHHAPPTARITPSPLYFFYFLSLGVPDKTPLSTFMFTPYLAMRQRYQEHFIPVMAIAYALYSTSSHTCSTPLTWAKISISLPFYRPCPVHIKHHLSYHPSHPLLHMNFHTPLVVSRKLGKQNTV